MLKIRERGLIIEENKELLQTNELNNTKIKCNYV